MPVPVEPKIYHIVHLDRLPSIVADGGLLCDADVEFTKGPYGPYAENLRHVFKDETIGVPCTVIGCRT